MFLMKEENLDKYGYVSYSLEEDFNTGESYVLINLVYVYPKYRRQGYARKILNKELAEIKKEYKNTPIRLAAYSNEGNIDIVDLVSFYEDMNFEVIDTSGHAVIMELV